MIRAAILTELNKPLCIGEIEPYPLTYGQVRVRVMASGICGAQLQEIRGEKGNAGYLPHLMGHEGCGIVEEVGPAVRNIKEGDQVVMHWRKGYGIDSELPKYRLNGCDIGGGSVTTFNTGAVVSENRLTVVPPGTPMELCALLGCGLSTALGTIESEAKLKFGERILIVGCGGLGLNLILASRLAQASYIRAIDINPEKAEVALKMGAHCFEDISSFSPDRHFFDVIIDTTGSSDALGSTIPLLGPSGRYILIGQPKPETGVVLSNARHFFEGEGKTLKATQGGGFRPHMDIPRYVNMHRAGLLDFTGLITHRVGLDDVNQALELVREGNAGRILIEMP